MTAANSTRSAVAHFLLKFDGADAPLSIMRALREVNVESSLHLPDLATLIIRDPEVALIDDDSLSLGRKLEIHTQIQDNTGKLFEGEIVEVEPRFSRHDQFIVVRAFDRLHRLGRGTHARSFRNVSDMDLVRKIAGEVGLQAITGPASFVHDYVFQNNQSNLSFLQSRAAQLGYLLYVEDQTLCCLPPKGEDQAIELRWGANMSEFTPRLSSLGQPGKTTVRGWDPQKKQAVVGQPGRAEGKPSVGEGRAPESVTEGAFHMQADLHVTSQVFRQQNLAEQYAQAELNRQSERLLEASGTCGGNPALTAGVPVRFESVGTRFAGTYYVSSATHSYHTDRGYSTEFVVSGQQPGNLTHALTGGGEDHRQRGLAIGIVTNNDDPQNQGRVKLKYPWLTEQDESDWARVVSVGGGSERGLQFVPEVNDEVLVGFELGDIHHPYVIGGLWNGVDKPTKPTGELVKGGKVQQRVIRSRSGHVVVLDDSEGEPHILVQDKNGNTIKIDSKTDSVTIQVKGDARVVAQKDVRVQAQGDVQVQAQKTLELSAQMGVKIDGGGGPVDIKGVVINLN